MDRYCLPALRNDSEKERTLRARSFSVRDEVRWKRAVVTKDALARGVLLFCSEWVGSAPDRGCEGSLGAGCAPFLFGKGRVSTRTVVVKGALARGALLFFRNGSDRTSGCGCEGCLDAGCVLLARPGNGIFFDRVPCLPPPSSGQRMMTALMNRMPERRLSSSLRASRW